MFSIIGVIARCNRRSSFSSSKAGRRWSYAGVNHTPRAEQSQEIDDVIL
jgi:hypothetical protein